VRALVTGGAGFIGSHIVDTLLDQGAEVTIVDHLRRSPRPWVTEALRRGATLHVADVRDLDALRVAFKAAQPETVMHLAAQVDVRRSVADPALDAEINVAGTVSVLEAARQAGARRVILASTAATYGDPDQLPTPETAAIAPLSPYGTSKAAAEWYLAQYSRLHGLSTLALRMANVYGPRQDSHGEAGVVAIFAGAAVEGRDVEIYGDGHQTRDYVFVGDVVRAWIAASDADVTGALNISTGTRTSVLELARELKLGHRLVPGRAGEITHSCLDPSAAMEALAWRPGVGLTEGLLVTVQEQGALATPPRPAG
jgi:UDP-glucose 4-epimerase